MWLEKFLEEILQIKKSEILQNKTEKHAWKDVPADRSERISSVSAYPKKIKAYNVITVASFSILFKFLKA